MNEQSLRGQLTRASMLTTLVVLALCACALLSYELLTYRDFWLGDLRTQAETQANSNTAALEFNDPKAAHENLALFKVQPRIRAAAIYDRQGQQFAAYGEALLPTVMSPRDHRPVWTFDGPLLELQQPIEHDGDWLGTVVLVARHDIWSRVLPYVAILGIVMTAGLVLAMLVFQRFLRRVTHPLAQMTDVAGEIISTRNWSLRAGDTPYTDIAVLVQAFNRMLAELEAEMRERLHAERDLRDANRKKDEFVATLAHELRNPLAPMSTSIALLRLPSATPEMKVRAIGVMERQLKHMVRMIDDLLDVSRITTGKLSLQCDALDLGAVLRSAADLGREACQRKEVALTLHEPLPRAEVQGDSDRLVQVFSNLLSNACRYTPSGGRIDVALELSGNDVLARVRDTGIGIEPAMQERIFDLFEQGDKSLERGNVGLGIGLTLARQLVQLHGGTLGVFSEGKDRGATFTVRLPLLARPQEPGSAPPVNTGAPWGVAGAAAAQPAHADLPPGLRLLLADDNVDFAASLAEVLRNLGAVVDVVHDGEAAAARAAESPPEVALLDIGMPGMNGYTLARRLKSQERTRGIRLVALTGWGQPADKQAAEEAGFDAHLVKPVGVDALLTVLAGLEQSRSPAGATEPP
jgi:signal transduction histidine kinase/ActR/RegA family two-component response regulator